MSTHDRLDNQEHADAPKDTSHGLSLDDAEAMDEAVQAEESTDVALASASDADTGDLRDARESQ